VYKSMKGYIELAHKILENDKDKFISLENYRALQAYRKERRNTDFSQKNGKKLGIYSHTRK